MGSMPLAESYMDQTFTDIVVSAMGPKTEPRTRQLMGSLIKHMHDFARENELTMDEWMEGMKILNWAGKLSDDKINHMQLLSDILGLES
jgi:catechol 1,2-dioxygenase